MKNHKVSSPYCQDILFSRNEKAKQNLSPTKHNVVIHESSTVFFDALNLTSKMVFLCFYRFLCDIGAIYYLCFFIFRHASVSNLVTSVSSLFLIQDVRLLRLDLSTLKHQDFSVSYLIYPSMLQIHYSPGCDTC